MNPIAEPPKQDSLGMLFNNMAGQKAQPKPQQTPQYNPFESSSKPAQQYNPFD